ATLRVELMTNLLCCEGIPNVSRRRRGFRGSMARVAARLLTGCGCALTACRRSHLGTALDIIRPDRVPVTPAGFRPALALVSLVASLVLGTPAVKRSRGRPLESPEAGASGSEPRQDPDRRERARVHVAITDPRHRRRRPSRRGGRRGGPPPSRQ